MQRITIGDLRLNQCILEIKYPKGYRYWDVCGQCILEIASATKDELDFHQLIAAEECVLIFKNYPRARATFGYRHMTLSAGYLQNVVLFKEKAPLIFDVVRSQLDIGHLDRVGLRFTYVYPTDTSEMAEDLVNAIGVAEVAVERLQGFGSKVDSISPMIVVSDGEAKVNIRISSASRQRPAGVPSTPEDDEYAPEHCVLIDLDFSKEHVDPKDLNLERFIHGCQKKVKDNLDTLLNR